MVLQLIYTSVMAPGFGRADIDDILQAARRNNPKYGITGVLICASNAFLQVLEGEHDAVMTGYERIGKDPRHQFIMKLRSTTVAERSFPDWSMGLYEPAADDEMTDALARISSVEDVTARTNACSAALDATLNAFARRRFQASA